MRKSREFMKPIKFVSADLLKKKLRANEVVVLIVEPEGILYTAGSLSEGRCAGDSCPENHISTPSYLGAHLQALKNVYSTIRVVVVTEETKNTIDKIRYIGNHFVDRTIFRQDLTDNEVEAFKQVAKMLNVPFENCVLIGHVNNRSMKAAFDLIQAGMHLAPVGKPDRVYEFCSKLMND